MNDLEGVVKQVVKQAQARLPRHQEEAGICEHEVEGMDIRVQYSNQFRVQYLRAIEILTQPLLFA